MTRGRVTFDDVAAAARRIEGVAHRTPVFESRTADRRTSCRGFYKGENLQRVGAFKFRGAYNALSLFSDLQRRLGVVAFSSGNHAQAIALAARLLDIPATIVMPENAPEVKLRATRGYGADIVLYDPAEQSREALAAELAENTGMTLIPSFDHPHVVAGQGTAALELFDQAGPLDALLVPCGGGGLLSGCALVADAVGTGCRVIGVEPARADDATRSFHTGDLQRVDDPDTIADGARTPSLGEVTFPLVLAYVADMVTVEEEQIVRAMRFLWERMKLVVEPTGALAAAALLEGVVELQGARVGVILSGGNVDIGMAAGWFGAMTRRG